MCTREPIMADILLFFLLLQRPLKAVSQNGDCRYRYLHEPPSDISCNPWSSSAILRLQCQASAPPDSTVEIHWFVEGERLTMASTQIREINDNTMRSDSTGMMVLTSTVVFENGAMLQTGSYYCQIWIEGRLTKFQSSSFLLRPESDVTIVARQPCNVDDPPHFISTNRCVGNATPSSITPTPTESTSITMAFNGIPFSGAVPSRDGFASNDPTVSFSTTSFFASSNPSSSSSTLTDTGVTTLDRKFNTWLVLVAGMTIFAVIVISTCVGACVGYNNCRIIRTKTSQRAELPKSAEEVLPKLDSDDHVYETIDDIVAGHLCTNMADMKSVTKNPAYEAFGSKVRKEDSKAGL